MTFLQRFLALVVIMAFSPMAIACTETSQATNSVTVTATEFAFQPATIDAKPGQTLRIKFVNEGRVSHNLHLAGIDVKTKTIQAGNSDTIEITVPDKDEIRFVCAIPGHEQAGMMGKIVIDR